MDIIQLLPDSVANQIAAGEVIQRPASVIKELVENAVDAGARRIDVIILDAGRTSLQVVDDGKGMSETDARLAFERHATSKIRQAADLFTLTTMGFRGEALPSIAAVSQVELQTRTAEQELGTHLILEGSKVISQEPAACPVGANFLVKNLFFNVPARRKFLKSNQTELSNIMSEMERIVLVHPDIAFTLTHNGTPLFSLTPSSSKQRIAAVFGQKLADKLLPVEVETPMVTVRGFVGKPEASRKRGAQQFFFVNDRYMRHPYFHRAVQEAFAQLIPVDEQVPYFLYFTVPPAEIDVNIHPTKTEIKFENEQAIWQILLAAIRESLGRFNAVPSIDFDTEGRPADIPVYNPIATTGRQPSAPRVEVNTAFNPFDTRSEASAYNRPAAPRNWEMLYAGVSKASGHSGAFGLPEDSEFPEDSGLSGDPSGLSNDSSDILPLSVSDHSADHFQYRAQYIVTAVQSGLMFIDQHRAHIRILYDRYLAQMATAPLPSQRLLFPDVVQLSATNLAMLEGLQPQLRQLGMEVTPTEGMSVAVAAIPTGLEGVEPQRLLLDLLAAAADEATLPTLQIHGRLALTLARAAAIPVGQVLSLIEMQDLVAQLFATQTPNFTPDGHTVLTILPQDNIDKLFK
ncbi:MAG: DNA mismatch repair endonuclease MutL [Bacteroidaceae bacterium]|nr:DNA mismatch repair endonuclease MutL [Bacteroidaceae bacterium]